MRREESAGARGRSGASGAARRGRCGGMVSGAKGGREGHAPVEPRLGCTCDGAPGVGGGKGSLGAGLCLLLERVGAVDPCPEEVEAGGLLRVALGAGGEVGVEAGRGKGVAGPEREGVFVFGRWRRGAVGDLEGEVEGVVCGDGVEKGSGVEEGSEVEVAVEIGVDVAKIVAEEEEEGEEGGGEEDEGEGAAAQAKGRALCGEL